jgi:5'-deoxynucleotidase YfbR-like HD superfamily hydrolase
MIYVWIASHLAVPLTFDDLYEVLVHDVDEGITGDMPSTSKKREQPTEIKKLLLKLADCFEAFAFVKREQDLGNSTVYSVELDLSNKIVVILGRLSEFYPVEKLNEMWDKFDQVTRMHQHPALMEEFKNYVP